MSNFTSISRFYISLCSEHLFNIEHLLTFNVYKKVFTEYTGWILMIDQKYFLTVTQFWAQTIFYAYGGLTKGGPFDKIAFSVFESI